MLTEQNKQKLAKLLLMMKEQGMKLPNPNKPKEKALKKENKTNNTEKHKATNK